MTATENDNKSIGTLHWLFQIAPPLLMLGILFSTNSGTALFFLAGLFVLPVIFSVISIIAKLIFFKKRKYYLPRPVLTIAIFILILGIAHWSYGTTLEQVSDAAKIIQQQCNANLVCPENPVGWELDGSRVKRSDLGKWFKYSASYHNQAESFNIRVYHGPDVGHNITGGVNVPFEVAPYQE